MPRLSHGRDALSTAPPLTRSSPSRTSVRMTSPANVLARGFVLTVTSGVALALALASGALSTGCSDASSPATPASPADAAVAPIVATSVAPFDATKFELAEGLALRDGNAFVSQAPLGTIVKVTPGGIVTPYASVPAGYNDGYTLGLAFDAQGALFAAQTKNSMTAAVTPGIYKLPAGGSATPVTTPFATDPAMTFPNGIVVGDAGDLLVTDSASGVVFHITSTGTVTHGMSTSTSGSGRTP